MLFVVLLCQYRNILSYMQKGHVLQVIFVECQVFYVWNMKKRGRESVKEKSSLASQSFFPCVCMCVRKWAGEGKENTSGQTCQVFVTVWYAQNVFHVYIMTIISIIPGKY